jgi:hypothetical protein
MVEAVEPKHVLALRDAKADTSAGAFYLIRILSAAISRGVQRGYRSGNPRRHVRKLKIGEGYAPWTWVQFGISKRTSASPSCGILEAGCTDAEVSAITGQPPQMVEHYARMVSQERLAAAAVLKWESSS